MRVLPALALLFAMLLPSVQAHAAPDPLDNETHLLADGGDDTYAYTGGLDLQDLFAREAWHRPRDAEGVIFRMVVYGSAPPGGATGPLRLTLDWASPGGGGTLGVSSPDGLTFTSEGADLVEASMEAEGTAVQGSIQLFVAYDALGAVPGQAIEGFTWRSWVGEDLRDVAPGGRPVPGSQGAVEVPEESAAITPSLALAGPRGYTRSTARLEGGAVAVEVQNLITATGQHIMLGLPEGAHGWTLGEPEPAGTAADPGQHPAFRFSANAGPDAGALTVYVTTDLGGREALVIHPPGSGGMPAEPAASGDGGREPDDRGAPGLAPGLLLAGIAALAIGLRRLRP